MTGGFQTRAYLRDRTFRDFALTVRMRKTAGSYAGLVVRDHWRVYLQMMCFLSLNCDVRGQESQGELRKAAETFPGYHDVKVGCAGPLLHAFVDGNAVLRRRIPTREGRIGFYAHGGGQGYYDDVRIETRVAPEYFVLVEPVAPNDCLVVPPGKPATLRFRVSNWSAAPQTVTVSAAVKDWDAQVVTPARAREATVPAGGERIVAFETGALAAGFYRVDVHATCAGKDVSRVDDLPLAVHQRPPAAPFQPPVIPVAAYYKYFTRTSALYRKTYAHAAARSLRDHHFNAVVADPSFDRETIDIFQAYGLATIARGKFLDHPAVIATLLSDEPKPAEIERVRSDYERLGETTDKPITTCMVGEGIGLGGPSDPVVLWRQLAPALRCFRWYGIKKSHYGLLHGVRYKGWLPLPSVLRIAEASSDTPYWFVPPALGKTHHEAYYHKPTPAQTRGLMHLALANGADGILFWALQSHGSWACFVEQDSLQPTDGCYEAAGKVAAHVADHAELIRSLEHTGLDIRCPSPAVDAVPRKGGKDGKLYVYAVNRDTRQAVSTRLLLWAEIWTLGSVRDVFADESLTVARDEEGYWSVPLKLEPGQGRLLATDAAIIPRRK